MGELSVARRIRQVLNDVVGHVDRRTRCARRDDDLRPRARLAGLLEEERRDAANRERGY
jgi:hypothetical protein